MRRRGTNSWCDGDGWGGQEDDTPSLHAVLNARQVIGLDGVQSSLYSEYPSEGPRGEYEDPMPWSKA